MFAGYNIRNSNLNSTLLDGMKADKLPDVVLIRKVYDRTMRQRRRNWKLKRLVENGNVVNDSASVENEFEVYELFELRSRTLGQIYVVALDICVIAENT